MRPLHFTALLAASALLNCFGDACDFDPLTPQEYFEAEGVASVHKVTVLRAYKQGEGPNQEFLFEVRNDETFKGCGKRQGVFVVQDPNWWNRYATESKQSSFRTRLPAMRDGC